MLSLAQIQKANAERGEAVKAALEETYGHLSNGFGNALYATARKDWGAGPATIAARLNTATACASITAAWRLPQMPAGVLFTRVEGALIPLVLASEGLAIRMADRSAFWVDFARIQKELSR